jgi:ABC-2 type transport system permease protein
MNGYRTLLTKELRESLATYRALIAVAVFLLAGIGGPVVTHLLPELVRNSTSSGVTIIVGKQTAVNAIDAYLGNMNQLPMLAAILLAMGTVAEERSRGVSALVLYRPISRAAYILAKLSANGLVLLGSLMLGALAALYYIVLLFGSVPVGPYLAINLGLAVLLLDVLTITVLCSTLLPSGVAAGGLAFVLYIILSAVLPLLPSLEVWLPTAITGHAHALLSGAWGTGDVLRSSLGGLLLAAACAVAACLALARRDV